MARHSPVPSQVSQSRRWYCSTFGLAAMGAAILWAALPPLECWPLAWIAPVPWILLIRREGLTGRRPYHAIWLAGFLFWLAAIHWLRLPHPATILGWIGLSFYLSFYLPIFVGLSRVAVHRLRIPVLVAAPVVWMGLELARAHVLTGFSMAAIGHTQYRWLHLIQISDLAGAYAVDFVMLFVAACAARMLPLEGQRLALWPWVPATMMLAATLGYGYARIAQGQAPSAVPLTRIALIQGSIDSQLKPYDPREEERIRETYVRLTLQAIQQYGPVDMVVWPETTFRPPWITFDADAVGPSGWSEAEFRTALEQADASMHRAVADLARQCDSALLLGIDTQHFTATRTKLFNSAIFVTRQGQVAARYDKIHCVMFGEYVPLADRFAWLYRLTPLTGSVSAGSQPIAVELEHLRIAPNICYESVLAHVIRNQVVTLAQAKREPDVLVNLTNDGWFWGSSELDMHLACGVFRAIESRKPFLIAANTGFSAWIDGDGRILDQGPRRAEGALLAKVRPDPRKSWYLRYGDWPAGVSLAACLGLAGVGLRGWFSRRRASRHKPSGGKA